VAAVDTVVAGTAAAVDTVVVEIVAAAVDITATGIINFNSFYKKSLLVAGTFLLVSLIRKIDFTQRRHE
jgi:hypothetical protein